MPKRFNKTYNKVIPAEDRKTLDSLSYRKYEFGGGIDFNHKGLERIQVARGNYDSVDLPKDFEVLYHTHTGDIIAPSLTDLDSIMVNNKQSIEIILSKGRSLVIYKTIEFLNWYKKNRHILEKYIIEYQNKYKDNKTLEKVWLDLLKRKGLKFKLYKKGEKIELKNVRIIEPIMPKFF